MGPGLDLAAGPAGTASVGTTGAVVDLAVDGLGEA